MSEKLKEIYKKIICGAAIGVGFVLPGVSGGVLAVSMGLFEPMIEAIKGLPRRFMEGVRFLLPIGLGGVVGVLLTSLVLKHIIEVYEAETLALFVGFMLGSLPVLWNESLTEEHRSFSKKDVPWILGGFLFMMVFMLLDTSGTAAAAKTAGKALPPLYAVLAGVVLAVGIIVPGLSSSFLLEYFGLYKSIVNAIADVYIPTLFFAGLGFILPAVLMVLLISFLFKKQRTPSYLTVMGISVGSMALIVPDIMKGVSWICLPLMLAGLALGLLQSRHELKSSKASSGFGIDTEELLAGIRKNKKQ